MEGYGKELILDLHYCNTEKFNRHWIRKYFTELCDLINMQKGPLRFWDDVGVAEEEKQTDPHLVGTSAVQFILTSSIVLHALDMLRSVYINIFSCKDFESYVVEEFTREFFGSTMVHTQAEVERSMTPDDNKIPVSPLPSHI